MKKMLARVLAILMVLNLGVFPTAYAVTEYPNPYVYDTAGAEVSFKFDSGVAGTLYYAVVRPDTPIPTAAEVKTMALATVKTAPVFAGGSVVVNAGSEGTITVSGLKKGTYKLLTTTETNGVLTAVTMKEFSMLLYDLQPTVIKSRTDGVDFAVKVK